MRARFASLLAMLAVAVAGCGGGHSGSQISEPSPPSVVSQWPVKWCQAQPGITKDALYALMGPPSAETDFTATWVAPELQFNAAFDTTSKRVRELDILHADLLDTAKRAAITCATKRVDASIPPPRG
jgi:hypothetical protein